MQGIFYYLGILAFASGILARSFFVIGWTLIAWFGLIMIVVGLWWFRRQKHYAASFLLLLVVAGSSFTLGIARLELLKTIKVTSALSSQVGTQVTLEGLVVAEPELSAKSTRLVVDIEGERLLVSTDRYADIAYGDIVSFTGKLQKPEAFETEFGRAFDYPGYLAVRDIFYTVSFATIELKDSGAGNPVLAGLFGIKQRFLESIQNYIPEPEVGLGAGLLLGVKSSLGGDIEEAFRTTGIIHIVVLSGANIMLVVIFVMYVLALFLPVRPRAIIGIITIILFAVMVGLSATVVRASIMAGLILVALLLGRQYLVMRALFFAGVLMLLINPLLLVHDVGFQLSFMATLGLIIVAPQLESIISGVPSGYKFKEYFLATLATQIAILPLLLYQIGQFSVVAVLVNMLVLPIVPFAMLFTFISGLIGLFIPVIGTVIGAVAYLLLKYIISVAMWFGALPFSAFIVPAFPFGLVVIAYGLIAVVVYRLYYRSPSIKSKIDYSTVSAWTIVDESEIVSQDKTKERERRSPSNSQATNPPIFFR